MSWTGWNTKQSRAASDGRYRLRRPLLKRIKELEAHIVTLGLQRDALLATCIAARNWYALDGDGISEPVLGMLKVAVGEEAQPSFFEDGAWWPAEARKPGVVYDSDSS